MKQRASEWNRYRLWGCCVKNTRLIKPDTEYRNKIFLNKFRRQRIQWHEWDGPYLCMKNRCKQVEKYDIRFVERGF